MNQEFLDFAHTLADAAAAITLPAFRNTPPAENKAENKAASKDSENAFDPVTDADREAEAAIRTLIESHYPDHAILGEEYGTKAGTGKGQDYQWVLDPIDGTRAFISGIPTWGTLIALTHKGVAQIGVLDQPFIGERFYADTKNATLRHNGKTHALRTRAGATPETAIIATTTPALFENTPAQAAWTRITKTARLTRYGGDCYNYALLAAGHLDAVIEQTLHPFDILALVPLIEAAGGIITDWQGAPLTLSPTYKWTGQALACGDPTLHTALLKLLAD